MTDTRTLIPPDAQPGWSRSETVGIVALLVFTVAALVGYGVFGRHPALLAAVPEPIRGVYGIAFSFFAQAQVALSGGVLLWILYRRAGWRWLGALGLLYVASLASELSGTRFGVPFGAYSYTELLGPRWFGLVPFLIPLSWFAMAVPSWGLARRVVGRPDSLWGVLAGSMILAAWDLSLDPAMSHVTRYWVWGESGIYYGMPLVNLVGWYVTGLVLMGILWWLRAGSWLDRIPSRLLAAFYGVNLLMPLGMNAVAGLGWAVLAGLLPLLAVFGYAARMSPARVGGLERAGGIT